MSNDYPQFFLIKETLEDMVLFLRELEQTVDILEANPSDDVRRDCELKLVQLHHHLIGISDALTSQKYV